MQFKTIFTMLENLHNFSYQKDRILTLKGHSDTSAKTAFLSLKGK